MIRPEWPADAQEIRTLHEAAFGGSIEAGLVERLRDSEAFIPDLSLVAVDDADRIVGHVLITWVDLADDEGEVARRVLSLAPLAVLPERQNQGIGSALTEAGIAAAEARGEPLIVLIGHPWYYPRFGFEPARQHGLESPVPARDEVFMVRRLASWEPGIRGRIVYPPAFDGV
ncbi:MAG: putative acetyltransferase [Chloroflexota bacterium]|jgi:putative acetyltransferase|nr:putative acetyltransferase [Chloroflexota bacterium]